MYNRYIPTGDGYERIVEDDTLFARAPSPSTNTDVPHEESPPQHTKLASGGLATLLKGLKLEDLDTGDVLLLLIILFLFLEGDNTELIITLGLLLLLGLE